jgi:probable HAF family extracellular repeat protein
MAFVSVLALTPVLGVAAQATPAATPATSALATYTITDLGTLGGLHSEAYGINAKGDIIGSSATADRSEHAVLWHDGRITDLGGLGAKGIGMANAINDVGQIAGIGERAGRQHAVLLTPMAAGALTVGTVRSDEPADSHDGASVHILHGTAVDRDRSSSSLPATRTQTSASLDHARVRVHPFDRGVGRRPRPAAAGFGGSAWRL